MVSKVAVHTASQLKTLIDAEPNPINLSPLPGNVGWRDSRPPPKLYH